MEDAQWGNEETIMRRYKIKAFGITREILGARENVLELNAKTVAELRQALVAIYPQLSGLRSLAIAVNSDYADDTLALQETDEIALIPPVSGG